MPDLPISALGEIPGQGVLGENNLRSPTRFLLERIGPRAARSALSSLASALEQGMTGEPPRRPVYGRPKKRRPIRVNPSNELIVMDLLDEAQSVGGPGVAYQLALSFLHNSTSALFHRVDPEAASEAIRSTVDALEQEIRRNNANSGFLQ